MIDRQKIIIMSKLALYDKKYAYKDRRKVDFFRHDYVYRQNIGTRFFAFLGSVIVAAFYFIHRIFIGHLDILDITGEVAADLIRTGIFIVLVQVLYSILGFLIHSREYNEARERIDEYFENMNKLSRRLYILEQKKERRTRAKEESYRRYEYDDRYEYPED